jgi:putative ABC transport system permease protein
MRLLSEWNECLWIAADAVRANKMRAALTTLGIVIGIVTVTLMATAIQGLRRSFTSSVSMLGADVLYVERYDWFINSHAEWLRQNRRRQIDLAQFRELDRQVSLAQAMAPIVGTGGTVKRGKLSATGVRIIGTTDAFLLTGGISVDQGRFLSAAEAGGGRPLCVLGSQTATNLFPRGSPLGERVHINGFPFEVIGVLERQGEFMGAFSLDNQVVIPITQFTELFWRFPDITVQVKAGSVDRLGDVREEVRGVLRKVRRLAPGEDDDFAINEQDQFLQTFNRVAGVIAAGGLFITGLSLFVGGIGIMNIMFVSVAERTKEIGIRKAIGAKRRTILAQFLVEAAMICLLGGLIGLGIAWPATWLLSQVMPATLSWAVAGLALLVSALVGLLAGFLPAWRAARLDPVDALRSE